ncbi:hypothetical protein F2Q70_00026002 [Brassica cretica]|uniref:Uncharacterized protein n=1 Tax=Brassica cretica TaxID=69181 RepID=A0A8S9LAS9_BRACR|nr:hypothetical protein F2Q70_00026002 [Brassica cretica]
MNDPLMGFDSCEQHPKNPPGPENICKWSGNKRDGRIPLPMAKIALRGECRKWFHGSSMEGMIGAAHGGILSILEVYDNTWGRIIVGTTRPYVVMDGSNASAIPYGAGHGNLVCVDHGLIHQTVIYGWDAPVVRVRLIGFIGTWFHGRLVHERTWIQGSIRLRHGGTEPRPSTGSGMKYKRAVRVDGELGEATSQLYQLEESGWNLK